MMSTVLATIAFMLLIEGFLIALIPKKIKETFSKISKDKKGIRILRNIGLWEVLIGLLLLLIAILARNL